MRNFLLSASAAIALLLPSPALAWGSDGDYYVGNIAWELLTDKARLRVSAILGQHADGRPVTLAEATDWSNCLLAVKRQADGSFAYTSGLLGPTCDALAARPGGAAEMEGYVSRNWEQHDCAFPSPPKACHRSFHFTEISAGDGQYAVGRHGSGPYDLVHAAMNAFALLSGKPAQPPFDIRADREALFLLAHSVADLHQPLHVATLYLGDDAKPVHPTAAKVDIALLRNTGAARIRVAASNGHPEKNLHEVWDVIDFSSVPTKDDICSARAVMRDARDPVERPALWASHSIVTARDISFSGLSFAKDDKGFLATAFDRSGYETIRQRTQRRQLIRAGAHLAQLLNELYAGGNRGPRCN